MKKLLAIILTLIMLITAAMLAGCGDDSKDNKKTSGKDDSSQTETTKDKKDKDDEDEDKDEDKDEDEDEDEDEDDDNADYSSFKRPAEAVKIDLSEEDPSNGDITFNYDDEGRVIACRYESGGEFYNVSYSYGNGSAQIYVFSDDGVVMAAEEVSLSSAYDESEGFKAIGGYYFKGYKK